MNINNKTASVRDVRIARVYRYNPIMSVDSKLYQFNAQLFSPSVQFLIVCRSLVKTNLNVWLSEFGIKHY